MNNISLLADLIKNLRTANNFSQYQMTVLLKVPRATYSMIESGHRKPTNDILVQLSTVLNFDLVEFSRKIDSYEKLEHYLLSNELIKFIKFNDNEKIKYILENDPLINEFNYGEPEIIKIYSETLVLIHIDKDIESAYSACINFFNITELTKFQPKINMPNQYYSLTLNLGYCLCQKNLYDDFLVLYEILINFLENLYFKSDVPFIHIPSFYRRYYIICLNNIADAYFNLNKLDTALELCNKGIAKSNEFNILNILLMLLKLKVEILCSLNNYQDAKSTYIQFRAICEITEKMNYFESSTNQFKVEYPNLFE